MNKLDVLKKLREQTGISIAECKKALEKAGNNLPKAQEILIKSGQIVAVKKQTRITEQGIIESYVHANGKIGVILELNSETDFVAKNTAFKELAHDLALQIASMDPKDNQDLLEQEFIKEPSLKIADLITQKIQTFGENIKLKRFVRYQVGEENVPKKH